ncbi:histidine kinase [Rhodococcus opacus]|uniref:sensor histidine kinase n=1 Tax=Rhodococcus TaxID=1827 RepID=UPI0002A39DB5|nr:MULTISPECIES: histidine kinase [Rhodococcus]ELB88018.1 two-component histidine kinase [Rhodococcus wratislaviensis IFP 2016]NHU45086.1 histidine kinase [Rhodococcus sp. A14]NKY73382.1 histidine kinase [Rhodococcus opacus]UNN03878.1 histidine kinase [Rhodococcus opacus]CAG7593270.1 Sensor histidine kinase DesK [Rhodococcus opacus]
MTAVTTPDGPVVTRRWGRFGFIFAAAWTVFLFQPFLDGWAARDQVRGWIGMIATLAFAVTYLAMFRWSHTRRAHNEFRPPLNQAVPLVLALFGLAAVMVVAVGSSGLSAGVFLAVSAVMLFPAWLGGLTALTVAVLVEVISTVMDWGSGTGLSLGVCAAAFAMFGVTKLINRNIELVREREASERLAVQEERTRMARDLHDILGHSLTVITVKAELVGRLLDIDIDRARTEVADLERLSRDALADVRQAVQGIRGLSLPVEIARAGEALRSAGIEAELPNSTESVPTGLRELFAWTVREGVTNVVRHSGATHCSVTVGEREVTVVDDGAGCAESVHGNGLVGLRERAAAAGARVVITHPQPGGFSLHVLKEEVP